jgi:diguanylate cyclase (GGDEF)-like protein
VVAGLFCLCVLFVGSIWHVDRLAIVLATVALLTAGLRSSLSLGDLRFVTESHKRQALTDELTGLGNRRRLMTTLDEFFSGQPDAPAGDGRIALLLIDLDHFKEINDSFGHPVGDQILKMLGSRLLGAMRSSDVLTRLGGDEFGVVLADSDADHATILAERLTREIEEPFALDIATLHVRVSIGIAMAPKHAWNTTELLRCADVAMYRAKAARSPFEMYELIPDGGHNRIRLVEQLRHAITAKELQLYFQPQYDLRTGMIPSVEALLRWPHATLGVVSPGDFIPLAEEASLMQPLTELVLEAALAQCAAWRAAGRRVCVAVNLSATNLLDGALPERIRFMLARNRLGPDALVLEVTETTMLADLERSQQVIRQLHEMGLVVSVDDFGTGFSSLAYLSELAVGELKIDQALVQRLTSENDGRNRAIVRAAVDLGHSLGLRVVAEGVEDAEAYEQLASLGCDLAQGFLMCRPLPADQLTFAPSSPGKFNLLAPMTRRARRGTEVS